MASIKQKNSSVPGKAPLPADIERGELAVNLADRQAYTKDQTDAVVKLASPIHESQDLDETPVALGGIKAGTLTTGTFTPGTYTGIALTGGSGSGAVADLIPKKNPYFDWDPAAESKWIGWTGGVGASQTLAQPNNFRTTPAQNSVTATLIVAAGNKMKVVFSAPLQDGTVLVDGGGAPMGTWHDPTGNGLIYDPALPREELRALVVTPGSGYTAGDVLTIPDGTLGTGSTGNTYTVDRVATSIYPDAPAGSGVVVRDPAVADGQPGAYKLATINTDAASLVPDLKDVTIAAAPYDQPPGESGYLTRVGGKSAGDADEYQLTPANFVTADNPPANPHVGMMWLDTGSTMMNYVWNGTAWVLPGNFVPLGAFTASFDIEADPATPVTLTLRPSGAVTGDCIIDWGDGNKTAGSLSGSHTYAVKKRFTVTAIIKPDTAVLDGNGWPQFGGCTVKKIGPFSDNAKLKVYLDDTANSSWYDAIEEMDYTGVVPSDLTSFESLFEHRPLLFPEKIKGVDKDKISSIKAYIRNRKDLDTMLWADGAAITNAESAWENTILARINAVDMPECTSLMRAFQNAVIGSILGTIRAPKATSVSEIFRAAQISYWHKPIDLDFTNNPRGVNFINFCKDATIIAIDCAFFADHVDDQNHNWQGACEGLSSPLVKDLHLTTNSGNGLRTQLALSGDRIKRLEGVRIVPCTEVVIATRSIEFLDMQTVNSEQLNSQGFKLGYNWSFNTPWDSLTAVGSDFFGGFDWGGSTPIKPVVGRTSNAFDSFTTAKLIQSSVDNLLVSLKACVVDRGEPGHFGGTSFNLSGSGNAAPSTTGTAAATALTAAGWTITTN